MFQMSIEMLFEWVDVAREWILGDRWSLLGSCLTEYVRALEKLGCEYLEQLLKHCRRGEFFFIYLFLFSFFAS